MPNKSIKIFSPLIVLLMLCCCNSAKKERIIIYSPHGKELLGDFKKLYEIKHPDVSVEWMDMGSEEIFDRISTESKNPQADIWWGAPATLFMKAEKLGLLETFQPSWANQVPNYAKSKTAKWYGTFATPEVIAFNNKKFTESDAPKDWDELATEKWKDKIVLRNPMASGTLRAIFCAMIQQSIAKTGNEQAGWEYLSALDKNTAAYTADPTQMYAKLGGENVMVTLWNMPDIELQKNNYNYPFGYVFPANGTVVLTDGIAIIKGTKHLELAKDFYEFVTNQENLLLQAQKYHRIPARTDLPKEKLPEWLQQCNYKVMDIDWNMVAEKETEWMQNWNSKIKSKK